MHCPASLKAAPGQRFRTTEMYFKLLIQLYDRKKPSFVIGDRIFITYIFRKKSLKINSVKTFKVGYQSSIMF